MNRQRSAPRRRWKHSLSVAWRPLIVFAAVLVLLLVGYAWIQSGK
jgi:hypothetical protein